MKKSPIATRFIAVLKQCITENLSKIIKATIKLLYKSMRKRDNKASFTLELTRFW